MCSTVDTWVFTFGYGQKYADHFVRISGTFQEARQEMINRYGTEWAFQYSESEWNDWINNKPSYVPTEVELI